MAKKSIFYFKFTKLPFKFCKVQAASPGEARAFVGKYRSDGVMFTQHEPAVSFSTLESGRYELIDVAENYEEAYAVGRNYCGEELCVKVNRLSVSESIGNHFREIPGGDRGKIMKDLGESREMVYCIRKTMKAIEYIAEKSLVTLGEMTNSKELKQQMRKAQTLPIFCFKLYKSIPDKFKGQNGEILAIKESSESNEPAVKINLIKLPDEANG